MSASRGIPARLAAPEPTWSVDTDVVVLGSGAAGLSAALAARRKPGGQTCLPAAAEKALALLIVTQWKAGLTLTTDQVLAMASIEAKKLGSPFQVRLRAEAASWGFGLSPNDRMPRVARLVTGTAVFATRTSCPESVPSAPAPSTGRRRRARPM